MIAFTDLYNTIYQRRWVVVQICFIWAYSFGMLVPSLAGQWGECRAGNANHFHSITKVLLYIMSNVMQIRMLANA